MCVLLIVFCCCASLERSTIQGLGCRIYGLGFRVSGLGFTVSRFRVLGFGVLGRRI